MQLPLKIEVKPHEWRKELFTLYINEERERDIHSSIFGKKPILPTCLQLSDWKEMFDRWEYKRTRNYVIWRLSNQSYHSEQLQKLLKDKLVQPVTIQKVIQECKIAGYLNDEDWISSFMRSHQKKHSLRSILVKLQTKGLTRESLEQIKQEWNQSDQEKNGILTLLRTRYQHQNLRDFVIKQKVVTALMRKGYSFDLIETTIREFIVD
ncbi:regulatory protein RecX [Candidatus Protochlamydia amoebophila]|uniref:Regulatory protein RecX n=1 Tax=Protochlamydia amoebophila (strain UWE25) TaxID=264201 RepID=Q6MEC3_PARUW|nr:regulatory protein RecX [Candidatus Protochlamydia amoebophila]CAF23076.1 unnamed protein product [Candidatus Protochlamydia amoebophila UWE25]